MNSIARFSIAVFNIYLISSLNILQVLCADRPGHQQRRFSRDTDVLLAVNDIIEVARVQQVHQDLFSSDTKDSKFASRQLDNQDFSPSRQYGGDYSGRPRDTERENRRVDTGRRAEEQRQVLLRSRQRLQSEPTPNLDYQNYQDYTDYDVYSGNENDRVDVYDRAIAAPAKVTVSGYDREVPQGYNQKVLPQGYDSQGYDREVLPQQYQQGYDRAPYHDVSGGAEYFESVQPNRPPQRSRYSTSSSPQRQDAFVRFPEKRPPPAAEPSEGGGGLLGSLFGGLLKRPARPAAEVQASNEPSYEFVYNNVEDDGDRKTTIKSEGGTFIPTLGDYEDYNINYEDNKEQAQIYDFKDVLHSIRNNESRIDTLKKFLSAASSLTSRAGTDPSTMLLNMPLTLLSILGGFYALSAVAVIGYKYFLLTTGSTNGNAVAILPVVISFLVPAIVVTIFLVARSALDGQINLGGLARGDLKKGLRQDFDGLDFAYDAAVGSTALLGLGWMVSVIF